MPAKSRRRGRNAGRAAVLVAALLLSPGHLHSQAPGPNTVVAPVLPLKQVAYIKASNAEAYDHLADGGGNQGHSGNSVALSADGNTMAVGAPYESSGAKGVNGNQFGFSIALSGDGSTVAVGAITEDSAAQQINGNQNDDSAQSAGAVYVYARTGNTWAQQAYVKSTSTEAGDLFGFSAGLSADGNTLAVAAFDEDGSGRTINPPHDNLSPGSGALYVFTRQNGTWSQQAYIKASRGETSDGVGFATASH